MNKKLSIFLAVAASACVLATTSGCSSSSGLDLVALNSNWLTQTSGKTILPSSVVNSENFSGFEQITYSVKNTESSNGYYSVSYEGTYTTLFYAVEFNYENFGYPDEYKEGYAAVESTIYAYYYRTELNLPDVTYTYTSTGSTVNAGDDSVIQECYFLSVGEYLRPLYSKQTIVSSSPASYQPSESGMYSKVNREYENFYNLAGTEVTSVITVNDGDESDEAGQTTVKNSAGGTTTTFFDISSLNIAVRALNLSTDLSQTIKLITSGNGMTDYTASGSDTETGLDDTATASLIEKMKAADLLASDAEELETVAVSIAYSATTFTGGTQTMWFAALAEDSSANISRATLLKMETPLSFSLGTLVYTLESIDSTM